MKNYVPTFEESIKMNEYKTQQPKEIVLYALELLLDRAEIHHINKAEVYNVLENVRNNKIKI